MIPSLYGEGAVFVDLEIEDAPLRATRTLAAADVLRNRLPEADVVVGAGTIVLSGVGPWGAIDDALAEAASAAASVTERRSDGPLVEVPTVYDGPDLDDVAAALGRSREDVIRLHAATEPTCELVGFLPGFAYLGPVAPELAVPRRATPRKSVPAKSVAIAGGFTGVYPFASPGGWHLLGRALVDPFDARRDPPTLFAPGTRARFVPLDAREQPTSPEDEPPLRTTAPALVVLRAPPSTTVQDGGRGGKLSLGLPPSGPLDPQALAAANLAVGNAPNAAAIEIPLGSFELRAVGRLRVSVDGEAPVIVDDDASFVVPRATSRAVRVLAIGGGVDVPVVLGARATLLVARLGGFHGRALRAGDVVPIGLARDIARSAAPTVADPPPDPVLHVDPGPHLARTGERALDALLAATFRVSRLGDRVGVRFEGASVPSDAPALGLPVPMVRGAIELTPDGTPIALGPDHPTTGGYPVVAVLRRASQALLARLPPGHAVRFRLA